MRQVGGFQMLYADSYHSRQEFEAMFDHRGYRAVRLLAFFGAVWEGLLSAGACLVRRCGSGSGATRPFPTFTRRFARPRGTDRGGGVRAGGRQCALLWLMQSCRVATAHLVTAQPAHRRESSSEPA